jgi:hypothetical protein
MLRFAEIPAGKKKARKLACDEPPGSPKLRGTYLTFRKMMAKVYSAIDSISTSARMSAKRIAAVAPGLRARPSAEAAVAFAWAKPQPADAMAMLNPAEIATQFTTPGAEVGAAPCPANAAGPNSKTANAASANQITFLIVFSS